MSERLFSKKVPTAIGGFNSVSDSVGEGSLCDFALGIGLFRDPITEGTTETVRRKIRTLHTL